MLRVRGGEEDERVGDLRDADAERGRRLDRRPGVGVEDHDPVGDAGRGQGGPDPGDAGVVGEVVRGGGGRGLLGHVPDCRRGARHKGRPAAGRRPCAPAGGGRGASSRPAGRLAERWTCVRGPTYSSNTRSSEQAFEHRLREAIVRRYDEPVQVRLSEGPDGTHGGGGPVPDAFLWRNRLYVVREVLASWLEREAWWEQPGSGSDRTAPERTVWRVEAGAGRALGTGVYDLAQAVPAGVPAMAGGPGDGAARAASAPGEWRLLCHLD